MPYRIRKVGSGYYRVENPITGKVHARRTTKRRAQAQVRLLRDKERGEA